MEAINWRIQFSTAGVGSEAMSFLNMAILNYYSIAQRTSKQVELLYFMFFV